MITSVNQHYIDGQWVNSDSLLTAAVVNPATEDQSGEVVLGSSQDLDKAVKAAQSAFECWAESSRQSRLDLFDRILSVYKARIEDMAQAITLEMGAPLSLSRSAQAKLGLTHFRVAKDLLAEFKFDKASGTTVTMLEPVGVCGLITPWNWPVNQIACKVAPAVACGCTVVLKPSELAPFSAKIFAEIMDEAEVPAGVFNLVFGDGAGVGSAISEHKGIDMVSFTGSARAGTSVSKIAANTVKRVSLELGGKSPYIVLEQDEFDRAVTWGARNCFRNTGQSCNAPTRMLVPRHLHDRAVEIATKCAEDTVVGDPTLETTSIGPIANQNQYKKVTQIVDRAIAEGVTLAAGGSAKPEGLDKGYFVRPTVFANVSNDMSIAREEVFGPVLVIIPYDDLKHAVDIANDTDYGLAAYIDGDLETARKLSRKLRAGNVFINEQDFDPYAPFGGYKQSGNGREWGEYGFHEFLEVKGVVGYGK